MALVRASNLWQVIQNAPDEKPALISADTGLTLTYGELREQVMDTAAAFASFAIVPGDRVAIALPNGFPAIICFLAASIAGTAAPLNLGYKQEEFAFFLEDTSAKLLIVPAEGGEEAIRAAGDKIPMAFAVLNAEGKLQISGAKPAPRPAEPAEDQIALVLHTSGSTGRPKRVPLKHRNLAVSAYNIAEGYGLTADDVSLCVMPLFHVHGLVASVLATFISGGTVVVPGKFNALSFWRTVRDYNVTWYSAVPTIHQLLLARISGTQRPDGAEKLRFVRSCSAPLPAEVMQRMEACFGVPVVEAYGMTEASHQMATNMLPPGLRKGGHVGRGTGLNISIMDEAGLHQPLGSPGEVVIKGPGVTDGYENNAEANATSFVDGWFRTGDQGVLDEDGYLRLIGRLKEMINRGGEKISPRELDELLLTHPAVSEAVCFGMPHRTWGEEVAAAVVLKEPVDEAALNAFCAERVADFKRPKKFFILDAIPRTATGKVQRRVVAAQLIGQ